MPHNAYLLENAGDVSGSNEAREKAICATLEPVAEEFHLQLQPQYKESTLCYFVNFIGGFELYLGARRADQNIVIDTGAWNRDQEFHALSDSVETVLKTKYPAFVRAPHGT